MYVSSLVVVDGDQGDRVRDNGESRKVVVPFRCGLCVDEGWVNRRVDEYFRVRRCECIKGGRGRGRTCAGR